MLKVLIIIILLPIALICLILTGAIIAGILGLMFKSVNRLVEVIKEIMKCWRLVSTVE